jgi:hypothetical protein
MRSLSWLGWAALTSAAGIIYLALALVPGPEPGPLADLAATGEESETPIEPDGPKLEPVEFIDLTQVPRGPFANSAEPPLAGPPESGVVQAVAFQPNSLPAGEPFDGPTLPVMPYCKDDAYPVRACGFELPAVEELPAPENKGAPAPSFPFFFGSFPIVEPVSDCIHFGKAPNCWTATAVPYFILNQPMREEPRRFDGEEQEAPPKVPQSRRLPNGDDTNPTHPEVDSAEVRPSDLPKNYGRTPF